VHLGEILNAIGTRVGATGAVIPEAASTKLPLMRSWVCLISTAGWIGSSAAAAAAAGAVLNL
jgi:hypothetical protein